MPRNRTRASQAASSSRRRLEEDEEEDRPSQSQSQSQSQPKRPSQLPLPRQNADSGSERSDNDDDAPPDEFPDQLVDQQATTKLIGKLALDWKTLNDHFENKYLDQFGKVAAEVEDMLDTHGGKEEDVSPRTRRVKLG
jgi:hypothetical protein